MKDDEKLFVVFLIFVVIGFCCHRFGDGFPLAILNISMDGPMVANMTHRLIDLLPHLIVTAFETTFRQILVVSNNEK